MALSQKFIDGLLKLNNPGSTQVELFRLYYSPNTEPSSFFPFSCSSLGYGGSVTWQGVEYQPLPAETEGFEVSLERLQRPKLRLSNENLVISQILRRKNDLKDAKIARIRTQVRFLDDANFDGGENPFGSPDPTQEIVDTFILSQKLGENKLIVEFECTSPYDVSDFTVPARSISPRYCHWQYRGCGCNYWGPPVGKEDGSMFSTVPTGQFNYQNTEFEWQYRQNYISGSIVYIPSDKDPYRTYYVSKINHVSTELNHPTIMSEIWEKDACPRTIGGCRKRFIETGISYSGVTIPNPLTYGLDTSDLSMPFGGFPATDKYARGTQR